MWEGCISANLSLRVSLFGWEDGVFIAVSTSPLHLTVSLPAVISFFSILASLSLSIHLSHLLLSFSVFGLFFSVRACVSLCVSFVSIPLFVSLSMSLFLSVPVLCMLHCLFLSIFFFVLVIPQSPVAGP